MRKTTWRLFLVAIALGLGLVTGQPPVVHSALPQGNEESSQFCGYGTHLDAIPESPTSADDIQVIPSGEWSSTCVPHYLSHSVVENRITVNASATYPPGIVCAAIIMPWEFAVDIGKLPEGSYEVQLYIDYYGPPALCATTVLAVSSSELLITAVHGDSYLTDEPDEAFRLMNVGASVVDLADWTVTDQEGTITLSGTMNAGASVWIAREADDFAPEFGFPPDYEYGADTDPTVPNLPSSGSFSLANGGDEIVAQDSGGAIVDSVVYAGGDPAGTGWSGPGIYPYGGDSMGIERFAQWEQDVEGFGIEGQILYRKLDQATGLPVPDTDTAADWAQATDDNINGKKVQYPGWDLERYFFPETFIETAILTYAVAPDNIYETVLAEINEATTSIYYEGYTFDNAHLAEAIVARMQANPGMTVTILLEGEPIGGIEDQEKWVCQQIENAGGQIYFMYSDNAAGIHERYHYQHGKWMIIDEEVLLTGSEDLNYSSIPADDKSDGTEGNRGVWLITDAPSAVAHALDLFRHDLDPAHHRDLWRWTAGDPTYGAPPAGFVPNYSSGGTSYAIQFPAPLTISGTFSFEMVQSPENSLRHLDSLLGMVGRADSGDTVLVEQLYEYTFWGATTSNPTDDPNLRLEGYIAAARRGAKVRILLDSAYDDPGDVRGNTATCTYVNDIAATEGLNLACKLANPAGTGIHNQMVLVLDGGTGWVHTGSINGSESSSKNNRELAVQVQSAQAYDYMAEVFGYDWGGQVVFLPLVMRNYSSRLPYYMVLAAGSPNCTWTGVWGYVIGVAGFGEPNVQMRAGNDQGWTTEVVTDKDGYYQIQFWDGPKAGKWFVQVFKGGKPGSERFWWETTTGCDGLDALQEMHVDWKHR